MIYSNQRFLELSQDQIEAEHEQLSELRGEHYRQLLRSGTVRRLLGSTALSNGWASKEPLHEGTSLYPYRRPLAFVSVMESENLYVDAGIAIRLPHPELASPAFSSIADVNLPNYALCVGRVDETQKGSSGDRYYAGLQLAPETAAIVAKPEHVPFTGMQEADLLLIRLQLAEIAQTAEALKLSIVDPLTLTTGQGLVVGYEESDNHFDF